MDKDVPVVRAEASAAFDGEWTLLMRVDQAYATARREVFDFGSIRHLTEHQVYVLNDLDLAERELQQFREQRRGRSTRLAVDRPEVPRRGPQGG